jgi:hypothetical protein
MFGIAIPCLNPPKQSLHSFCCPACSGVQLSVPKGATPAHSAELLQQFAAWVASAPKPRGAPAAAWSTFSLSDENAFEPTTGLQAAGGRFTCCEQQHTCRGGAVACPAQARGLLST